MKFMAVWSMLIAALAPVGTPVLAQAETSKTKISWAQEKFKYAVYGAEFANKNCPGLKSIHIEAAKIARDAYMQELTAAGMGDEAASFESSVRNAFSYWTCDKILSDASANQNLQKVPFLTEELFLALSYTNLEDCGIYDKDDWATLVAYFSPYIAGIKQRPDAALIDPVAIQRGKEIDEVCSIGTVADSEFTLGVTTYGNFLGEAVMLADSLQ